MRNSLAIPLVANAYKLHALLFNSMYAFPLNKEFLDGKISVKVDKILKVKHIPLLLVLTLVTTVIGIGSCFFLFLIKFFQPKAIISVVGLSMYIFLSSCEILEIGTYVTFLKATETENSINQLFVMERTRKFKTQVYVFKFQFKSDLKNIFVEYKIRQKVAAKPLELLLIAINIGMFMIVLILPFLLSFWSWILFTLFLKLFFHRFTSEIFI